METLCTLFFGEVLIVKQELISYLSTLRGTLYNLSKFLYENPETSYHEYKSYNYIVNLLKENNFKIIEHFLDINTSFYGEYGNGHPKICYLCEYDSPQNNDPISGHNLVSAMSIGAGLALSKAIDKLDKGTVILIGCPGEFADGSKLTMAKQGVFDDIDVVLMAHPHVNTSESGSSSAILPIKINYKSNDNENNTSALDACTFTLNSITLVLKNTMAKCFIDNITVQSKSSSFSQSSEAELSFHIKASSLKDAYALEKKVRDLTDSTSRLINVSGEISMNGLPYAELVTNSTLSRIFCHNLKESGIINIAPPIFNYDGLSIGSVSHVCPCIHPYISVDQDQRIEYGSKDFAFATLSDFAKKEMLTSAQALAITGYDLLENEELLNEVKNEFYEGVNK